jgi:hypothetical protein
MKLRKQWGVGDGRQWAWRRLRRGKGFEVCFFFLGLQFIPRQKYIIYIFKAKLRGPFLAH